MRDSDLLFADEAAVVLRRSPATLQYWRSHGLGPTWCKLGRRIMYDRAALDAFIYENRSATVEVDR